MVNLSKNNKPAEFYTLVLRREGKTSKKGEFK